MALNKNHEFEELDGVKCGIVERNVAPARVEYLKKLLEYNHYKVVVASSPPPKVAALPAAKSVEDIETPNLVVTQPLVPETFTVGVTDYTFNPINAIFGRSLKTPDGQVVTLSYWEEKEAVNNDEVPYYEGR